MYCKQCGEKNDDFNKFCVKCGAELIKSQEVVESKSEETIVDLIGKLLRKRGAICAILVTISMAGLICYATLSNTKAMEEDKSVSATVAATVVSKEQSTQSATTKETQVTTQASTQAPTQAPTQVPTQVVTQAPTKEATQAPTQNVEEKVVVTTSAPVNVLERNGATNLIELTVGSNSQSKMKTTALSSLFNEGLTTYSMKGNGVTLLNEKEGVMYYGTVSSSNSYTIAYCTQRFSSDNGLVAFFAHSYITGTASTAEITETTSEWRGIVNIANNGPILSKSIFAKGYMGVVVDKTKGTTAILYCVKQNPTGADMSAMYESVKTFTFTN